MAGPSKPPKDFISTEPTLSLAGTSSEPPQDQNPPTLSFSFKIRPASKLQIAMEALSDEDYNEHGMGKIRVRKDRFEITTINYNTIVMGNLRLNASGLIDFKYYHPFADKNISLKKINETIGLLMSHSSADDNETIGIHHVQGSNELCFTLGSLPTTKFSVELLEITDNNFYFDCPTITCYPCEVKVNKGHMETILEKLDTCEAKDVSFHITERTVCIAVGNKYCVNFYYAKNRKINGMEPGQMHRASFLWPHSESLKKALPLDTGVLFSPVTDPAKSVLLQVGDLIYNATAVNEFNVEKQKQVQIQDTISHLDLILEVEKL